MTDGGGKRAPAIVAETLNGGLDTNKGDIDDDITQAAVTARNRRAYKLVEPLTGNIPIRSHGRRAMVRAVAVEVLALTSISLFVAMVAVCHRRKAMVRAVAVELLALTSISLFVAMVAVWTQVLSVI